MSLDRLTGRLEREFGLGVDIDLDRTRAVVVVMLGIDAIWWWLLYDGHVPMPGTTWLTNVAEVPMAAPGAMELATFHVGTLWAALGYAVMWGVMMWAMMDPAMIRFTREYARAHRGDHGSAALALTSFVSGYHLVWLSTAIVPLAMHAVLPGGIYGFVRSHETAAIGGALLLAGAYQLTSFKRSLLRSCCSRVGPHDDDVADAFGEGVRHGGRCVLICLGLFFVVMPAVGAMNLVWMVALTTVVALERIPTWGEEVATATGCVAFVAGALVLVSGPDLGIAFTT